ncbi:ribonuclease HIII [Bacillus sonorensis]|uniref:ribonuclease HIII n=1 Tax=Bacillus sonorensis TaxID=119858 RepID=UPI0022817D15|nr:ribonuclease HIII [Bacillus sonorensis]MCY8026159.1 ribonuclease HIII [Bacillus sonorensis]MEC1499867.1 ribonuclease HIII [Bacillus sonorensis]
MSHSVLKVPQSVIERMKSYYRSDITSLSVQGAVFQAKPEGCTITAYQSGKVLFQGKNAAKEAERWTASAEAPADKKTAAKPRTPSAYQPPEGIGSMSVIGSDEVGTGDYFGPMTVACVYADKAKHPLLQELGVKDSKHLKDPQIVQIARDLIKTVPYSLLVLKNDKYNELQKKGMSQGKMKALLHNQAITHLLKKLDGTRPEAILIDQFAEPAVYFKHLAGRNAVKERTYFSTKAEGIHLAVAAASIIARYSFLMEMNKLSKEAGMTLPKGAGPLVDEAAARLIRKHGEAALGHFTKLHFANTQKAKRLASKS